MGLILILGVPFLLFSCSSTTILDRPISRNTASTRLAVNSNLPGPTFTIINHSDNFFDRAAHTQPAVNELISISIEKEIPVIGIVGIPKPKHGPVQQLYSLDQLTHQLASASGSHELKFPDGKNFLYAGGNLSICLCESIRDTLRGTIGNENQVIEVGLVSDGIYESKGNLSLALPSSREGGIFVLEDLLSADDSRFSNTAHYLEWAIYDSSGKFCRNLNQKIDIPTNHFQLNFYAGSKLIISIGKDDFKKTVNLRFLKSSEIRNWLSSLN